MPVTRIANILRSAKRKLRRHGLARHPQRSVLRAHELDQFIARSDTLGGPGAAACEDWWRALDYVPSLAINTRLDPFSAEYAAAQMRLYEELAGHPYRFEQDEQTALDIDTHAAAVNPYAHPGPAAMGLHLQRLARALTCANAATGEVLLDMGCGWGLSSEVAAYLGLRVTGVDINKSFVELVNRRAARTGYPITAVHGTFDDFVPGQPVDLILFYECLHHAVDTLAVVTRLAGALRPGGRMILAGEPINASWWPHWGMRLDPLSIYCIRKFGWFESGWSAPHIIAVLRRAGLEPVLHPHADPAVGPAIIATKPLHGVTHAAAR
jgi:2-polyprenyl-3-methyl-5-hydroxy-6-metoxy-1,4-benzoquinol methylase